MEEKITGVMEETHSDDLTQWPEDIFSEEADTYAEEEKMEDREEEVLENGKGMPEEQEENQEQTFTLKHLGKETQVTLEELIALGQKGLDYDFVKRKNEELKNAREVQMISRLAEEAGMTKEEYLSTVEKTLRDSKISGRVSELIESGMEEQSARMVADLEMKNKELESRVNVLKKPQMEEKAREQRVIQDLRQLVSLYPGLQKLPDTVVQHIKEKGIMPTVAYQQYLIEKQEQTIKQLEKNMENANKSTGSVKGEGVVESDPFLMGFNA